MSPKAEPPPPGGGVVVVVPCFNEALRLDEDGFLDLVRPGGIRLVFVDDGSDDGTPSILERLEQRSEAIELLKLGRNAGKAEAVRQGLLRAVASGAAIVGYLDADLATPGRELARMVRMLEADPELAAVFGSRIARLGSHIERSAFRHYTGRVFATVASMALGIAVYDTQCGAKVFRVNDSLVAALRRPFRSPWSFDVLLCQRLLDGTEGVPALPVASFVEMPLEQWTDKAGSKVDALGSLKAVVDVLGIGMARRWRGRRDPLSLGRPTDPGRPCPPRTGSSATADESGPGSSDPAGRPGPPGRPPR